MKIDKLKKGASLLEMLITIGIFSLIMVGLAIFFNALWSSKYFTERTAVATFKGFQGVNRLIGTIREARQADNGDYAIDIAEDNRFVFYSDFDDDDAVEKICYELVGSDEIERRIIEPSGTPVSYSDCSSDSSPVVIVDDIVNESDEPIFSYYDENNNLLTIPVNLGSIRLVKVSLFIDDDVQRDPERITFESFAALRNLSANE